MFKAHRLNPILRLPPEMDRATSLAYQFHSENAPFADREIVIALRKPTQEPALNIKRTGSNTEIIWRER